MHFSQNSLSISDTTPWPCGRAQGWRSAGKWMVQHPTQISLPCMCTTCQCCVLRNQCPCGAAQGLHPPKSPTMEGTQLQPSTPTPPPLFKMPILFRRSGPHLVPVWRRKKILAYGGGVKLWFYPMCVYSKCMGNPSMYTKNEKIF